VIVADVSVVAVPSFTATTVTSRGDRRIVAAVLAVVFGV
jgi:hypothetical protein